MPVPGCGELRPQHGFKRCREKVRHHSDEVPWGAAGWVPHSPGVQHPRVPPAAQQHWRGVDGGMDGSAAAGTPTGAGQGPRRWEPAWHRQRINTMSAPAPGPLRDSGFAPAAGRAGKAVAAAPAGTTKAPEGLRAKPSRHGPTAQQLSPSCNEAVCLPGMASAAWHGAQRSRAEGTAPQPEPGPQPGPRHIPATAGCSWFPGQGEQDGRPDAPPDLQPGAISAPLPPCGICSLSGGSETWESSLMAGKHKENSTNKGEGRELRALPIKNTGHKRRPV